MYTFIDISGAGGQTSISLPLAGVDGVIIKSAGANDDLYVAGGYDTLLAKGRAAYGNVGHYFFNGRDATPEASANYWAANVKYQRGDMLALDIEPYSVEGVAIPGWTPAEALSFLTIIKDKLGVVPMLYINAAAVRAYDWSACVAFGAKLWVASYGSNNGSVGAAPQIDDWSEYTVWQYTSFGSVPGWSGRLDMNLSTQKISEIHPMTNSVAGALAWARAHPTKNVGNPTSASWNGWCAALVFWAGGFSRSFTSAMVAGDWQQARGRLRSDWNNAPAGAIHYWAGVGGDGHTAIDVGGNILLMASAAVTTSFGNAIGTVSFQTYANKGIPYRGWSMYWGDETLAGSGTSGGGSSPIDNGGSATPTKDEDLMIRIQSTNRGIALVGAGYYRGLTSSEEVEQSGPLISAHYTGNDRQFDLWVAMAVGGQSAPSNLDASNWNAQAIRNEQIIAAVQKIPTTGGGSGSTPITPEQITDIAAQTAAKIDVPREFTITGKANA